MSITKHQILYEQNVTSQKHPQHEINPCFIYLQKVIVFYTFCCVLNWKLDGSSDGSKYCIIKTVKSIQMYHFLLVYRPSLYFKAVESQNKTTWTQTNFLIRYEYFQSHSLTHTVRYSARITVMQLPTQESLLSKT